MTVEQLAAEMHKFGLTTFNRWAIDGAAMLRQQAEQIESLKADAERYRKLKDSDGPVYAYAKDGPDDHGWFPAFGEDLDEAIDAMKGAS